MVVQDDGSIHIAWEPDLPGFKDHVSVYDSSFGRRNNSLQARLKATSTLPYKYKLWNRNSMTQDQPNVDYDSYMTSPSALLSCLQQLHLYGLLFIHSIPSSTDAVNRIAERIGPLKNTLYGSTWDVRSVPSAKNVAYTSSHLGFHMDLLYVDNPPGLQILHCLEASTQGGESLFSDTLRVVLSLAQSRPDHYAILKKFPVTYKYHNNHEWYQQTRPHIETSISHQGYTLPQLKQRSTSPWERSTIRAINWSPPFQAPFVDKIGTRGVSPESTYRSKTRGPDAFQTYIEAIRHFKSKLEVDPAVFEKKLEPGTAGAKGG
ncbi:MAG: hypothetical protein Q9171_004247 [Xanthocarpia ochracea]